MRHTCAVLVAITLISVAAAVGSFFFAGWQSQQVAIQTRLANRMAAATSLREAVRRYDDTLAYFVQYPELRPCFYGTLLHQ